MWCPYCGEGHVGYGRSFDYDIECNGTGSVMFVSECDDCGKRVFIRARFEFLDEDCHEVMTAEEYQESD